LGEAAKLRLAANSVNEIFVGFSRHPLATGFSRWWHGCQSLFEPALAGLLVEDLSTAEAMPEVRLKPAQS
jgi:hypothetical protein